MSLSPKYCSSQAVQAIAQTWATSTLPVLAYPQPSTDTPSKTVLMSAWFLNELAEFRHALYADNVVVGCVISEALDVMGCLLALHRPEHLMPKCRRTFAKLRQQASLLRATDLDAPSIMLSLTDVIVQLRDARLDDWNLLMYVIHCRNEQYPDTCWAELASSATMNALEDMIDNTRHNLLPQTRSR